MKYALLSILLLASIAGHGQIFDTVKEQYDTLKVIVEVYELPHKIVFGTSAYIDSDCHCVRLKNDSAWSNFDSTQVLTKKVLAWEVWLKEFRPAPNEFPGEYITKLHKITTLAFNKKDTLFHVLQSWRVEW